MKIVLSGGGTAGHINPALALAEVLHERGHEVFFAGTAEGVESRLVKEAGIPFVPFKATGFNRNHPTTIIRAVTTMIKSTSAARKWLDEIKPDVVVGFGGYVCIPVGRAAEKMGIPLVLHEQNSVMGLANKYLAKSAQKVALTYEESARPLSSKEHIVVTGNPVRKSIIKATREEGRALLAIPDNALVVLVFGGSLGARHINDAFVKLKNRLLEKEDLYIVHVTGPKEYDSVVAKLVLNKDEQKRWMVFGYQDKMGDVLAASDVVVARAGATSLAEISARHIPALLVPFPFATEDHQTTNAQAYVERGAAFLVADKDLDTDLFSDSLFTLIEDASVRQHMEEQAACFVAEDAAARLADVVTGAARR